MRMTARLSAAAIALTLLAGACTSASAGAQTVRLGFFPTLTHAPALVGVDKGFFRQALGTTKLETAVFNAGPAAVQALFADGIDAAFLGPNPSINAYAKSNGQAIRIVSGATSGGAAFVVAPSIKTAQDLRGKTVASPQLGNTQDVALRTWLASQGLTTTTSQGGDVTVKPQDNALTLQTFTLGQIAGAWVPEPWVSRLVSEGHGHILVDEATLWPGGKYVTADLVVRTEFLNAHPGLVRDLLRGLVQSIDFIHRDPAGARAAVNDELAKLTTKSLTAGVLSSAWQRLTFTVDPLASTLRQAAQNAEKLGLLDPTTDLRGIYDLAPLDEILRAAGKPEVSAS